MTSAGVRWTLVRLASSPPLPRIGGAREATATASASPGRFPGPGGRRSGGVGAATGARRSGGSSEGATRIGGSDAPPLPPSVFGLRRRRNFGSTSPPPWLWGWRLGTIPGSDGRGTTRTATPTSSRSPRRFSSDKDRGAEGGNAEDGDGDVGGTAAPLGGGRARSRPQAPERPVHDVSRLPASLRPYAKLARLDRPAGTWLLLHPCLMSTALAAQPLGTFPDPHLCALFAAGSLIMRGAGCTINDMWDAEYDRKVARTRTRPLAGGELSRTQAWAFLAAQLSAGLGVLLSLPHVERCFWWGAASLPLVATYPLAKRVTNYPQLVLGMTFNWGAIVGWVAVRGEVDWSVVGPLYAGCVAWTLVYDTLYAHQDKDDDARLGLKSTALTFGEGGTKPILTALTGAAWGGWALAGYNAGFGDVFENPCFYAGATAAAGHLLWQVRTADLGDPENLLQKFRSNNLVGWILFGSYMAGNVMAG
ncbi:hypothetical protein ACHAWF_008775 [Thalassiosira exigua]